MTKGVLFQLLASVVPWLRLLSRPPLPQTQVCEAHVLYKDIWGPLVFPGPGKKAAEVLKLSYTVKDCTLISGTFSAVCIVPDSS